MLQAAVLFIAYDGLTDPLGQAQVIPYLTHLAQQGYSISVLSCEKTSRFKKNQAYIQSLLHPYSINWHPISFSTRPPILAKFKDLYRLKQKAVELHQQYSFQFTHCRSYVAAFVGEHLKKKFGVKLLFDMRGFWVDERVDGNIWSNQNPIFRFAYWYYKKKEQTLIQESDAIISLTEAGKQIIESWPAYQKNKPPITVIPCCTDFQHFPLTDKKTQQKARQELGLSPESLVVSYLGSIGTWYLLDEMLDFFKTLKQTYPTAQFLCLTSEPPQTILTKAANYQLSPTDFVIRFSPRQKVPFYLAASDINLFFIKPCFSKQASSPVKLGEVLAMGIPVITNQGVGDVAHILQLTGGGIAVDDFTAIAYQKTIDDIPNLLDKSPKHIRQNAKTYYDLSIAIERYAKTYRVMS